MSSMRMTLPGFTRIAGDWSSARNVRCTSSVFPAIAYTVNTSGDSTRPTAMMSNGSTVAEASATPAKTSRSSRVPETACEIRASAAARGSGAMSVALESPGRGVAAIPDVLVVTVGTS